MLKKTCVLFLGSALMLGGLQSASAQTPLLHYTFDEASSGNTDAINQGSAADADGSFVGPATRIGNTPGGLSQGALDLTASADGNLGHVTAGNVSALNNLPAFSLSVWINLQDVPSGNLRLLANQAATSFDGFSWTVTDPASGTRSADNFATRMFVGGSAGFTFDGIGTHAVGADNSWTFLAVTYDGSSGVNNVNYYMGTENDAVTLLATTSIDAGTVNNSAAFNIGHTDAAPAFNTAPPGYLDDARVYGSVLSLAQLDDIRLANVPEPSTYALLIGGLALFFGARRWKKC